MQSGKNALIYASATGAASSGPCVTSYRQGKVHAAPLGRWCLSTSQAIKRHVGSRVMGPAWNAMCALTPCIPTCGHLTWKQLWTTNCCQTCILGCSEIWLFHKQIWRNPINELLSKMSHCEWCQIRSQMSKVTLCVKILKWVKRDHHPTPRVGTELAGQPKNISIWI